MKNSELIDDLILRTGSILEKAKGFAEFSREDIYHKPSPDKWSAAECFAHLVKFGHLYLPNFNEALKYSKPADDAEFRPGIIGNFLVRSMEPKDSYNVGRKVKTMKSMVPHVSADSDPIAEFIVHQEEMLEILPGFYGIDLNGIKIRTAVKYLKIRLGDSLRLYIAHNERHLIQAGKAMRPASN